MALAGNNPSTCTVVGCGICDPYSTSSCSTCLNGYSKYWPGSASNALCAAQSCSVINCRACMFLNSGSCSVCNSGYTTTGYQSGSCVPINCGSVATSCATCTTSSCDSCSSGKFLTCSSSSGVCSCSNSSCPVAGCSVCTSGSLTVCSSCNAGFYLSGGSCFASSPSPVPAPSPSNSSSLSPSQFTLCSACTAISASGWCKSDNNGNGACRAGTSSGPSAVSPNMCLKRLTFVCS